MSDSHTHGAAGSKRALDRPVDGNDHILGTASATLTLVEYGSYACTHCRAAHHEITKLRERFGDRLRYVFRHRPLHGNPLATEAAELVECADTPDSFWHAHDSLMSLSGAVREEDLQNVRQQMVLDGVPLEEIEQRIESARSRVGADVASASRSGVTFVPTFFINGRRYDGAWDEHSLADSLQGSVGSRVSSVATGFGSWAPSAALMLGLVTLLALILSNLPVAAQFEQLWLTPLGFSIGDHGLVLSLRQWINDGLLTLFFLAVGLEVKREFTVGSLANPKKAALPIAAALGGLLVPALLFLLIAEPRWHAGAGVPMPTDTAFAVALIVMLGSRVPLELRVFLTAASIVDDIGTILVVALFYTASLHVTALLISAGLVVALFALNRSSIYRPWPYGLLGILLWIALHEAGLHATLAGVLLAILVPTRPPANLRSLLAQAEAVVNREAERTANDPRATPSLAALKAMDAIHDRIESPADRLLRTLEPWSSYLVLPVFALANAGLAVSSGLFDDRGLLGLAVVIGLVIGKPLGFLLASLLVIRTGLADRPQSFSLTQMVGAGTLAGIGFTMSLFIAGQAFPDSQDFEAAKAAVFAASLASALIGCLILIRARSPSSQCSLKGLTP